MELIKQAVKVGNSAGVLLPRKYLNSLVKIVLEPLNIEKEVLDILMKEGILKDVMGIYLFGSYARGEETADSDIDILVITGNLTKALKEGNYDILFISKEKLENNLNRNLYLYSLIREAKVIFNKELIENYKNVKFDLRLSKKLKEISRVTRINQGFVAIGEKEEKVMDGTIYSIILRLRELFLINCLIHGKDYSNKVFLRLVEKESNLERYKAYLRFKNNE